MHTMTTSCVGSLFVEFGKVVLSKPERGFSPVHDMISISTCTIWLQFWPMHVINPSYTRSLLCWSKPEGGLVLCTTWFQYIPCAEYGFGFCSMHVINTSYSGSSLWRLVKVVWLEPHGGRFSVKVIGFYKVQQIASHPIRNSSQSWYCYKP